MFAILAHPEKLNKDRFEQPLKDIANIRHRNAGPTGDLSKKSTAARRNQKIDTVVKYASFGDALKVSLILQLVSF